MAKVSVSQRVAADAEAVWEAIGDFGGLAGWAEGVASCDCDGQDVGAVREVGLPQGRCRDRLESLDEVGRSYSYSTLEGALGEEQITTLKVWANRDGSAEVVWSTEFDAAEGGQPADGASLEAFYRASLDRLKRRFD